ITTLAKTLNIDEETARSLARAGMNSIDGILEADPNDIAELLQIDVGQAQKIQESAKKEHERKLASI
ncbi:MAG TPA: helix-hairpin-helix domain-containing protein, partial [Chthoniobacterales bacterium]|nr:helix-hairpin-helix domain-containing protein [Chthoniobacterales bacterium]